MATYMCLTRRRARVPKKLMANTTQITVIAMSIGQISSAYSFDWVNPSGRVMAAATMIPCHPQKWTLERVSLNILVFRSRWVE